MQSSICTYMINDIVIITDIYLDMDNMDNGISISDIHIIRIHTVYIYGKMK